jgi:hypothetical protein
MPSQETDHVSPAEVTPKLGTGALDTWRPSRPYGGRLDKTGAYADAGQEARLKANRDGGVYTNQCLNLSKLWEGLQMTCRDFKPVASG